MPNVFKVVDWITMETLRLLVNKLQVAQFMNTDYNKEFTKEFAVGESVQVKMPQRFTIREGLAYSPQALNRLTTTITVDQIFGVDFEWDSVEKALKLERGDDAIRREYLEPAAAQLASEIDSRAALFAYQNTPNIVGVLGTDPNAMSTFMAMRQSFIDLSCPAGGEKGMIIPSQVNTALVPVLATQFNPTSEISRQYKEGSLGRLAGFDWYETPALQRHTAGTWAGAVTVNGAGQEASSPFGAMNLNINCTNGDTFKKGDVISIANVNQVNPMTRRRIGGAKRFVITADVTATGATATIPIYPGIVGPGTPAGTNQYQNVDALAANAAALTLFPGTAAPSGKSGIQALALHKLAHAMVGVKLEIPKAAELASHSRDPETGISVAFVRMFDPRLRKMVNRFDVLLGFGRLYADSCAGRVLCGG